MTSRPAAALLALLIAGFATAATLLQPAERPRPRTAREAIDLWIAASEPGEGHRLLEQFEGEWDHSERLWFDPDQPPVTFTGTLSARMAMGGRYLEQEFQGVLVDADLPLSARGVLGFNRKTGRIEMAWHDSLRTDIIYGTGTSDESGKVITFLYDLPDYKGRDVLTVTSPDRFTWDWYMDNEDGVEWRYAENVFVRKGTADRAR